MTAKESRPKTEEEIVPYFLRKSKNLLAGGVGGETDGVGVINPKTLGLGSGVKKGDGDVKAMIIGLGVVAGMGERDG
jgi:hypothetical protein